MFFHYLKSAYRNLLRNKSYSLLHIAGLSAGIGLFVLIFVVIRFETGFDSFHPNKDRIYRVLTEYHHPGPLGIFYAQGSPPALTTAIKPAFPEVEKSSGIFAGHDDLVVLLDEKGRIEKKFKEAKGVFAVEPEFFQFFNFPWLAGNPTTSLRDPNSVVLTQETAEKYFGDWKTAMGRTLKLDNNNSLVLKVTGILAPVPANTDFQLKVVLPYRNENNPNWYPSGSNHDLYLLLAPGVTKAAFDAKLRAYYIKNRPQDNKDELVIQNVREVHYYDHHSHTDNFLGRTIAKEVIQVLWIVGIFILVIACVNFINLSTAQAVNRSREVGVRKVLGGRAGQLRGQFLLETSILVLISVMVAWVAASLALRPISRLLDLPIPVNWIYSWAVCGIMLCLLAGVSFLSGFYPAIILSGFNPVQALKTKLTSQSVRGLSLRRSLVVLQFIIAQALIIGLLIMIRQMYYFSQGPMGFDREAIINVHLPWDSTRVQKIDYFQTSLSKIPGVQQVSFNTNPPATDNNDWSDFKYDHAAKSNELYSIIKFTDTAYLKLYHLQLAAGRNILSDSSHEFLINEELLHKMGFTKPEEVINKEMDLGYNNLKGPIVGILKDFHSTGFKDKYSGVIITTCKPWYSNVSIKLGSDNAMTSIQAIRKIWDEAYPNFVFDYHFTDEDVEYFYRQETQLFQLLKIFAAMAIFLGCLGLYGLASFMAVQRVKEVGVRKVLGASEANIVFLFSREFVLLITIAFAVAAPIAGYFMHAWLQEYAFRVNMSWWIFLGAGILSSLIALGTVSYHGLRAARTNPVQCLRTE